SQIDDRVALDVLHVAQGPDGRTRKGMAVDVGPVDGREVERPGACDVGLQGEGGHRPVSLQSPSWRTPREKHVAGLPSHTDTYARPGPPGSPTGRAAGPAVSVPTRRRSRALPTRATGRYLPGA